MPPPRGRRASTRPTGSLPAEPEPRGGVRTDLAGPIQLHGLTVTYGDRTVLEQVSARFDPGLTAIVGPSGCGKSTLLACVAGELSPTSGGVTVGDVDLTEADPEAWRSLLAWAPQRPWLTHGTLAHNLRVGRPGATDEELWQALERVDLGHTVAALPLGLESLLGQDGAGLSAGERARVALARVVLARRPYVLLDEPTAHLDAETEAVLLDTMRWLAERSTVVVVAHRPAVAQAADRVLSLPASSATHRSVAAAVDAPQSDAVRATPHAAEADLSRSP